MNVQTLKKKLLAPLAERLTDFAIGRGFVYVVPMNHILRGVVFRRSADPQAFYVSSFVQPLYVPNEYISGMYGGDEIECPRSDGWWAIADPHVIRDVLKAIAKVKKRFLVGLNGPAEFLERLRSGDADPRDPYVIEAVAFSQIMLGDYLDAKANLKEHIAYLEAEDVSWRGPLVLRAELLIDDIDRCDWGAARLRLAEYEQFTRKHLGLPTH